jgi:hypothetical protein
MKYFFSLIILCAPLFSSTNAAEAKLRVDTCAADKLSFDKEPVPKITRRPSPLSESLKGSCQKKQSLTVKDCAAITMQTMNQKGKHSPIHDNLSDEAQDRLEWDLLIHNGDQNIHIALRQIEQDTAISPSNHTNLYKLFVLQDGLQKTMKKRLLPIKKAANKKAMSELKRLGDFDDLSKEEVFNTLFDHYLYRSEEYKSYLIWFANLTVSELLKG